ncbi:MAG: hypothetical protein OCU24_06835 [Candidatus Methanospirare jalkutatii]|nr:hypothetical protein [Candidatus Methanospirare jalkutatii]
MSENNGRGGGRGREEKERGGEEKENRRERGEKERRLGKGLAAIISQTDEVISEGVRSDEVISDEIRGDEVMNGAVRSDEIKSNEVISGEVRSNKEEVRIGEVRSEELISNKLEDAVREATRNPRISLWSPKSAAVLRYLRKTVPEFSISEEARSLLEDAIKRKYGKIWEEVERRLK